MLITARMIDGILALLAFEALALLVLWARERRGLPAADFMPNFLAGAALLLALRAASSSGGQNMVGFYLALAGIAHIADLARRWRGSASLRREG